MLKWLVEHGADVNARDKNGNTILHDAFFYNNQELVEYLKELLGLNKALDSRQ